ncbi:hypothetical protein [Actinomadura sp. 9N215]|uniref:hypothetical protein n=1 Tax=Actinomadura sp. 9N215 TaxID=3375150 RepID=UPI0037885EDA
MTCTGPTSGGTVVAPRSTAVRNEDGAAIIVGGDHVAEHGPFAGQAQSSSLVAGAGQQFVQQLVIEQFPDRTLVNGVWARSPLTW